MEAHELERRLRFWGKVYGPAPDAEWDEETSLGSGALTGCLIEFLRVGIVTGSENDCEITARGKESLGGAKPMKVHPEADQIDRLCCTLYRVRVVPALVLRADYCMRGPRREKLPWVSAIAHMKVTRKKYSMELDFAKDWIGRAL